MNKIIIIILSIITLLIALIFIVKFINNVNEDKKITKENIEIIKTSYNNFKNEVKNYNTIRNDISEFINNFYYDTIKEKYLENENKLKNYDEEINKITKEIQKLDTKCNITYNDIEINNICSNYKTDYEMLINIFINDINTYNNKLSLYNKDEKQELQLFKSNYINDYIDYNNDNIFLEKDEVNG